MKYSLSVFLLLSLVSCGNPHVSSKSSGLEQEHPPLNPVEMECEEPGTLPTEIKFYSGTHANNVPEIFHTISKCKKTIDETFNSFDAGAVKLLTNSSRYSHHYELTHLGEMDVIPDKSMYLSDFFAPQPLEMMLMPHITQDGVKGSDKGVDSTHSTVGEREAFLWTFSSPVSIWSAEVVDLEAGSKLRLFDCNQELMKEIRVHYPGQNGNKELHFIGVNSNQKNICYISLSGTKSESVAVDGFSYGD